MKLSDVKGWKELRHNLAVRFSDKYTSGEVCKKMDDLERKEGK